MASHSISQSRARSKPASYYQVCRERHYPLGLGGCIYCGQPATQMDHVIPFSLVSDEPFHWVVPACGSCNGILSDRALHSVPSRARFIAKRLRKANRKALRSVVWDYEELADIGHGLQSHIIHEMQKVGALEDRLRHLDDVAQEDAGYCKPLRMDHESQFSWPRGAFPSRP